MMRLPDMQCVTRDAAMRRDVTTRANGLVLSPIGVNTPGKPRQTGRQAEGEIKGCCIGIPFRCPYSPSVDTIVAREDKIPMTSFC